jgi:hypothetical protein
MYSFFRIMNLSCLYLPDLIFKFNSVFIKFILDIYIFLSKNYAFPTLEK